MTEDRQMLIEELERELRWVEKNLAEGRGGHEMRDTDRRIREELTKLKKGSSQ